MLSGMELATMDSSHWHTVQFHVVFINRNRKDEVDILHIKDKERKRRGK